MYTWFLVTIELIYFILAFYIGVNDLETSYGILIESIDEYFLKGKEIDISIYKNVTYRFKIRPVVYETFVEININTTINSIDGK